MKNQETVIDELNKKIKLNMKKNKICSKLTLTGEALSILLSSEIIIKMPNILGASLFTGAALLGMGGCVFIECKKSNKYENIIDTCINELHGYALEENMHYDKQKTIGRK